MLQDAETRQEFVRGPYTFERFEGGKILEDGRRVDGATSDVTEDWILERIIHSAGGQNIVLIEQPFMEYERFVQLHPDIPYRNTAQGAVMVGRETRPAALDAPDVSGMTIEELSMRVAAEGSLDTIGEWIKRETRPAALNMFRARVQQILDSWTPADEEPVEGEG